MAQKISERVTKELADYLQYWLRQPMPKNAADFKTMQMGISSRISMDLDKGADPNLIVTSGDKDFTLGDVLDRVSAPKTKAKWEGLVGQASKQDEANPNPKKENLSAAQANEKLDILVNKYSEWMKGPYRYSSNSHSPESFANEVVKLVEQGADPNRPLKTRYSNQLSMDGVIDEKKKMTPMHVLGAIGAAEQFQKLKDLGGDPNIKDANGDRPTHYMVRNGFNYSINREYMHSIDAVNKLQKAGADFTLTNDSGKTPKDSFYDMLKSQTVNGTDAEVQRFLWRDCDRATYPYDSSDQVVEDSCFPYRSTRQALEYLTQGKPAPDKQEAYMEKPPQAAKDMWKKADEAEKARKQEKEDAEWDRGVESFKEEVKGLWKSLFGQNETTQSSKAVAASEIPLPQGQAAVKHMG